MTYRDISVTQYIDAPGDVIGFFEDLDIEGILIYPDGDFNEVAGLDDISPEMKDRLNEILRECHRVCDKEGVDIYAIAEEVRITTGSEYIC